MKLLYFLLAIPFFGMAQSVTTYNRSGWTVTASSEEVDNEGPINGRAATLIDGDTTTFWVSKYGTPFPHTLVFDMGVVQPVNQLYYVPRNNSYSTITKGSVSFGDDGITFGAEVPITFNTKFTTSYLTLPTVQNHRYFRITLTENRATLELPAANNPITAMCEMGASYNTTLPAKLTAFTVQATGTGVDLQWTTSLEQNSVSYNVLRSVDGLNNFISLTTLAAAANTNSVTNYTFTDAAPLTGSSFYRLELTSTTGPVQKSQLAYIEFPAVVYSSSQPKNLNVFYFIPSDLAAPTDFKNRMDTILVSLQTYFGNELQRNGRGYKTFNMVTDATHQKVNILVINGKYPKSGYPRDDASPIKAEVDAYIAAHPSPFYSDHSLIMLPAYSIDYNPPPGPDYDPDGVFLQGPFGGIGKYCYAMDYDQMKQSNLGKDTRDGRNSVKFIGGLAHELGHGLNLSHNQLKVSEEATLGTLLMSTGNYTYGATTTSLSETDAAILNHNQVFNDGSMSYYGPNNASISSLHAFYSPAKKSIIVAGRVSTTGAPVTDVAIYNDPNNGTLSPGMGANKDYDAVTWTAPVIGVDSFYIEEPIAELQINDSSLYQMKIRLIQKDGNLSDFYYPFDFAKNVAEINIGTPITLPCSVSVLSATASTCTPATNTYSLSVVVAYDTQPTGNITITTSKGATVSVAQTASPQTIVLTNIPSDGTQSINVTAAFDATPSCTNTLASAYNAPASCLQAACECPVISVSVIYVK